ncbi:MAG TPA: VWA domain-containing protein [Bacteroidales bacterium]|nr:VWA domain-containing protein [Bacteroidales bacterium]HOL98082.1 VWA domain-containing protein [Bacteroidales bacterium]HOM37447.1 VWA domain-containing protein [Bacteroidales bacterium]HPD23668.1 VWA domain-containing protein [Bacteroidales bacterium]HRS99689.1 VWA domain-containing protein [Bacteroidales bacterium]
MFRFYAPQYLWLMTLISVPILLFIFAQLSRRNKIKKIGDKNLLEKLIPDYSFTRRLWKLIVISLTIIMISLALARPQTGSKYAEVTKKGIELIVALDVSNSMLAQDLKPNRLENSKRFIERLITKLSNDKLGIVVFAGEAFIQMPLTSDVKAARLFLSSISPEMINVQGTAIGSALELASKSFSGEEYISKLILLITDGESHEDNPTEIASMLKEKGIKVFCVGIGNPDGAPIPDKRGGFKKDRQGNVVMTKLDEETLKQIAKLTDGIYVRATNSADASDKIISEISTLQKGEIVDQIFSEYDDKYQWFILAAIILLCVDFIVAERKNDWLKKINLFKTK